MLWILVAISRSKIISTPGLASLKLLMAGAASPSMGRVAATRAAPFSPPEALLTEERSPFRVSKAETAQANSLRPSGVIRIERLCLSKSTTRRSSSRQRS